ncbi:phage baseplate protein [Streptomyces mirabilis]|uniref:phage baseplate protein n=2 Tax=Streptomyces mirabilis TaxID=68239 RepID=UPI0033EEAB08
MRSNDRGLSRRRLLGTGGGIAAAALLGSGASLLGAGPAYAVVGDSPRFKLDGDGDNPVWKKSLHANWVMQSFAYDNVNQHIYFAQSNTSNTNPDNVGDLWITKTDTSGNELGSMALHNFGHGVSIAVEPYQGAVYLWTEWWTNMDTGFGTRIGRFKFVNGATLEMTDGSIQDRTPSIADTMVNPQPAIDPSTDRLWVRYKVDTDMPRIVGFDMSDARAGRLTEKPDYRLAERALPSRGDWGKANPFQGFAVYGRYAYILEGAANGPSYISVIDLNGSGQSTVVDKWETTAGQSLTGREPQGMAIWLASGAARLAFGFHSNTDGVRQSSVFYKSEFV